MGITPKGLSVKKLGLETRVAAREVLVELGSRYVGRGARQLLDLRSQSAETHLSEREARCCCAPHEVPSSVGASGRELKCGKVRKRPVPAAHHLGQAFNDEKSQPFGAC